MRKYFLLNLCLVLFVSGVNSQPWQKVDDFNPQLWRFPTYLYNDSSNASLYFAGRFVEINNKPYFGIAELKTDSFYQLGCGPNWNCDTPYTVGGVYVNSIVNYNSEIYVTGDFDLIT